MTGLLSLWAGLALPAVPPPQPVATEIMVGSYYFPGHFHAGRWSPMKDCGHPVPLLGYYRDGAPGVADWHIKWAVEHGISYFVFDWYYDYHTGRVHEHNTALDEGFLKAQYRDLMRFCIFWCNEEGLEEAPYTEEQMLTLGRVLGERYFGQPNYLRIDGRPVLFVSVPERLLQSFGEGLRELIPQMSQAAGLAEGTHIYFVAKESAELDKLRRAGFSACTAYNYAGERTLEGGSPLRAAYDDMVVSYKRMWERVAEDGSLPYIVPVSPGWDSRPWYGPRAFVRTGATPEKFSAMCEAAKGYVDPHLNMVIAECWNEFGEGSFIEPTEEHGFGALDAIRDSFAVGADLPPNVAPTEQEKAAWTFHDIPPSGVSPGASEQRGNLLPRGDMEEGRGWLTFARGDPGFTEANPHSGTRCLAVDPGQQAKSSANVAVVFGRMYSVSAWVRCEPGASVEVVLALFGHDGRWLRAYHVLGSTDETEWTQISAELPALDPGVGAIDVEFVAQGGLAYADDVTVTLIRSETEVQPVFADACEAAAGWALFDGAPATIEDRGGPCLRLAAGSGAKTPALLPAGPGVAYGLRFHLLCDGMATVEARSAEFDAGGTWLGSYAVGGLLSWQEWIEVTCTIRFAEDSQAARANIEFAPIGGAAWVRDVRVYPGRSLVSPRVE